MVNSWFKTIIRFLLGTLFLALLTADGFSQGFTSPIQWHHTVFEARVSALGQSTATLYNGSSYHMNPAVPLENGVLTASSFVVSTTAFESPVVPSGANLYSPAVSFANGGFSYSAMLDYTSYTNTNGPDFGGGNYNNTLVRFQTGYQLNENLSVGVGFLYSSYQSPQFSFKEEIFGGDASAWGITVGAHYRNQFESDRFQFSPQAGLSLNDLSDGFDFENSTMNETNLTGQIRIGLGLDISSKNLHHNRPQN